MMMQRAMQLLSLQASLALPLLLFCCCSPQVEALLASAAAVPQLSRGQHALLPTRRLAHHPIASGAVSQAAVVAAPTNGTGGSDGGLLLMTSYDATIRLLLDEIADTTAGDQIFLQLYLLEGGASSEAVLAALEEAGARRGVRVTFVLDVSYVSMLSRLTEKTTTLIPRVEDLATTQPAWYSCTYGSKPNPSPSPSPSPSPNPNPKSSAGTTSSCARSDARATTQATPPRP